MSWEVSFTIAMNEEALHPACGVCGNCYRQDLKPVKVHLDMRGIKKSKY